MSIPLIVNLIALVFTLACLTGIIILDRRGVKRQKRMDEMHARTMAIHARQYEQ